MNKKVLLALSGIVACSLLCGCRDSDSFEIPVMLTEGEGFYVTSKNPVKIKSGEDAVFELELEDGYSLIQVLPEGTSYSFDGEKLTVSDILYPETVELYASNGDNNYRFSLQNLSGGGVVESSIPSGRVHEGTRITVSATPKKDYEFLGWTIEKTLSNEGELVSDNLQYSFILSKNTTVHANFKNVAPPKQDNVTKPAAVIKERRLMLYYPNGGRLSNSEDEFYTAESSDNYFIMPNTLPGANELFVRDGYKLIGFSDTPDGSGSFYGIGHTARFADGDRRMPTVLYCIWEKYSDLSSFTYTDYEDGVMITSYSGNEETVVIPEVIDGKKVIKLSSGAISGDSIKTLMLPYCLLYAEAGAIYDCPELTRVHMSDAIREFPDEAFADTASFDTLHLDAAISPAFSGYYRNFAIKYQYLRSLPNDKPKLVVLSGSNTDHGVNTLTMEEALGGKYYCVNFGTDAAFNITFFLETVANMLSEGDIIIHNFEQMDYCRGTLEINAMTFQGLESNLDVVSQVDFSRYSGFFSALCEFNDEMRGNLIGGEYTNPDVHNKRGEKLSIQENYNKDDFRNGSNGDFYFSDSVISEEEAHNLSVLYDDIRAMGVTVLISYPSFNYNAIVPENRNEASYAQYDEFIRKNIDAPLISKVSDYIFEGRYMSNTDYHLNEHGRKIRTERLLRDFTRYSGDKYTPTDISNE